MKGTTPDSDGGLVAALLATSWRRSPDRLAVTAGQLERAVPLLLTSGAGSLCWRRLRLSGCGDTADAGPLRQAQRYHALRSAVKEQELKEVVTALRAAGVEPVLVKGWSVARLYPEAGLRGYDDIDLCVRPGEFEAARSALSRLADGSVAVDLHGGFDRFGRGDFDEVYGRADLVSLEGVVIRMPCAEDQLRGLCLHLLSHAVWRPMWLVDIAVAVERRPAGFDWGLALGRDRRRADWVACVIGLAHRLLGARVEDTPVAGRAKTLPRWLEPAVLRQWGRRPSGAEEGPVVRSLFKHTRHPSKFFERARNGWDRPILATVELRGPFNEMPRLPYQLGRLVLRAPRVFQQVFALPGATGRTRPGQEVL